LQHHSEALAEESRLCNSLKVRMLRFAQHDIDKVVARRLAERRVL
jgi:hypothetical protein